MANYVDNKRFNQLILQYHEDLKTNPNTKIPEEAGAMLIGIAEGLSTRYNFNAYTYRDEFVGDGILRAVEIFKKFDPTKGSNPFGYFTKVIYRIFQQKIKKEKAERSMRDKLIMIDDIYSIQEGDDCPVNRDIIIGDFQFDSMGDD